MTVDSPWYDRKDATSDVHAGLLRDVDAVLPSEEDVRLFRPGVPPLSVAHELVSLGAPLVVVKLGAAGCLVVTSAGLVSRVPAYPATPVDPTGAGDAFCGGFLVGLRETGDPVRAAMYGTVSASFVVEERAAMPVLRVTRAGAEERLAGLMKQKT